MTPWITLRTALSSLGASKLRSGLTLLGLVIGVTAVITLMALGKGAQETITSRIESLGTNLLFVRPGAVTEAGVRQSQGSAATLTLEDAYSLLDPVWTPGVVSVAPELQVGGQVVFGRENTSTRIVGVTPEYETVRNYPVASGQFISQAHVDKASQVAVLGSQVAEDLFGLRDPVGQTVRVNGRSFAVIGVLESKGAGGFGALDDQVLAPITTVYYRLGAQRTAQGGITVQTINLQVEDGRDPQIVSDDVSLVLRLRHRLTEEDDFSVSSQQETIEALEEATGTFVVFLAAIASISLLVGGIGIMNIMLVSVTERTREIGIRKAMGAKRQDILLQFVSEAVLLSLTGGAVGMLLGWVLSNAADGLPLGQQTLQTVFSGSTAILAMGVSGAIGLFFGIYPALRASRLHPIEALRHE